MLSHLLNFTSSPSLLIKGQDVSLSAPTSIPSEILWEHIFRRIQNHWKWWQNYFKSRWKLEGLVNLNSSPDTLLRYLIDTFLLISYKDCPRILCYVNRAKLRTHVQKLVAFSYRSSLQRIPQLSNTLYFLLWALSSCRFKKLIYLNTSLHQLAWWRHFTQFPLCMRCLETQSGLLDITEWTVGSKILYRIRYSLQSRVTWVKPGRRSRMSVSAKTKWHGVIYLLRALTKVVSSPPTGLFILTVFSSLE